MIRFSVTEGALDTVDSVLIDSVVLYNNESPIKTISDFSGNVVVDGTGIGNYIVISFIDLSSAAYSITSVSLKSGNQVIAKSSDALNIVKPDNKPLNVRLTCQFDKAYKCYFNSTTIGLPYATDFRQGVVRFAKQDNEPNKNVTVYSAKDTDDIIQSYIHGTDQYVPWDVDSSESSIEGHTTVEQLKFTDDYSDITNSHTSSISLYYDTQEAANYLYFSDYIGGFAVSSTPTITTSGITGSSKLVTENYISDIYSNSVLGTSDVATNKLVSGAAVDAYVTNKLSSVDSNYVHIADAETVTGSKTFSAAAIFNTSVSSPSYIGTGIYSTYTTDTWGSTSQNSRIPTVSSVRGAIGAAESSITSAYQTADSNLQSQIDALNAGQNLADIVNTKQDLESLDSSLLDVNDKVQILHDKSQSDGTIDDSATGIPTVYSLTEGSTPYPDPRDVAAYNKEGFYWHYVGEYGVDSYTKSESDSTFLKKSELVKSISSSSTDSAAPTAKAVYSYASNNLIFSSGGGVTQTITSNLIVNGSLEANGLHFSYLLNEYNISCDSFTYCRLYIQHTTDYVRYGAENSSGDFVAYMQCTTNATVPYIDLRVKEESALKLLPIVSGSTITGFDVSGNAVANYSTAGLSAVTDGRLTTVDYVNSLIQDTTNFAQLDASNTFTGTTNTFAGISATSYTGTGIYNTYSSSTWDTATDEIPTVSSVRSAIANSGGAVLTGISTVNAVGAVGLFLYTEFDSSTGIGVEKAIGDQINGAYLKPIGMSLPSSGQISYKAVYTTTLSGTWKLLSVALKRTSSEPCLVLAQKISNV